LPFYFWSPNDFINDTIMHHLRYQPTLYSLTINTIYKIHSQSDIPSMFPLGLVGVLCLYLVWKAPKNYFGVIHASLLVLLSLFVMKQGFPNYYYGISGGVEILIGLEFCRNAKAESA
jgi:hypothetical protein